MPLQVGCPGCQKKLSIKQELLGKKIKCPECQTVIALAAPKAPVPSVPATPVANPASGATPNQAAASPQTPASKGSTDSSDKIVVACACGSKLRVPSRAAGKKVKCPKCKAAIPVPMPGTGATPTTPAAPSAVAPAMPVGSTPLASNPFDAPDTLSEADAAPLGQFDSAPGASPFDAGDFGQPAQAAGGASPFDASGFGAAPAAAGQFAAPAGGFQNAAPASGTFQSAAAAPTSKDAASGEEDEEDDAWYKTLGFGVLLIGISVFLYFYFTSIEEGGEGGRRRMNAIIALLYMIGGKWLPCGLLGGFGILCCGMGIKDLVTQKK